MPFFARILQVKKCRIHFDLKVLILNRSLIVFLVNKFLLNNSFTLSIFNNFFFGLGVDEGDLFKIKIYLPV